MRQEVKFKAPVSILLFQNIKQYLYRCIGNSPGKIHIQCLKTNELQKTHKLKYFGESAAKLLGLLSHTGSIQGHDSPQICLQHGG